MEKLDISTGKNVHDILNFGTKIGQNNSSTNLPMFFFLISGFINLRTATYVLIIVFFKLMLTIWLILFFSYGLQSIRASLGYLTKAPQEWFATVSFFVFHV